MDSLPFVCIPRIGFGEVHGVARFGIEGVDLQFQLHDPVLGVLRPELHETRIVVAAIAAIEFRPGPLWLKPSIELRLSDMGAVAAFPRSEDGWLQLRVGFRDRGPARRAVEQMRLYCSDQRYRQLQSEIERLSRD